MDAVPQLKVNKSFNLLSNAKGLYGLSTLSCLLQKISNNFENGSRLENAANRCFFIRRRLEEAEVNGYHSDLYFSAFASNSVRLLDNDKSMEQTNLKISKKQKTRQTFKPILMKPVEVKQEEIEVSLGSHNKDYLFGHNTFNSNEGPKMTIPALTPSNGFASVQDIFGDLNNSLFPYFNMNDFSFEKAIKDCPFLKSKVEVDPNNNQNLPSTSQLQGFNPDGNVNPTIELFAQQNGNNFFTGLNYGAANDFTEQQVLDNNQYISIPQFEKVVKSPRPIKAKPKARSGKLKPRKPKGSSKNKPIDQTEENAGNKSTNSLRDSSESGPNHVKSPENLSGSKEEEHEESERICFNCKATSTPLWRRTPDNQRLCNACGLYHKLHNKHRPLELKKSRDAKKPPYKPRALVCSNCHTNSASLWRRDVDTGNPVCNPCGLFKRLNHRQRPAHLYTNVIKKRHRNASNSNYYSTTSKDHSIKEETSPQYDTPVEMNHQDSNQQTPEPVEQSIQVPNEPKLFDTSNQFHAMGHLNNGMPFAVYPHFQGNFSSMNMPLFNSAAASLPNNFNLLNPVPYPMPLLNMNPLINFQGYEANFPNQTSLNDPTANDFSAAQFPTTLGGPSINNEPNTDQDPNKTSFSDFLSFPN